MSAVWVSQSESLSRLEGKVAFGRTQQLQCGGEKLARTTDSEQQSVRYRATQPACASALREFGRNALAHANKYAILVRPEAWQPADE